MVKPPSSRRGDVWLLGPDFIGVRASGQYGQGSAPSLVGDKMGSVWQMARAAAIPPHPSREQVSDSHRFNGLWYSRRRWMEFLSNAFVIPLVRNSQFSLKSVYLSLGTGDGTETIGPWVHQLPLLASCGCRKLIWDAI